MRKVQQAGLLIIAAGVAGCGGPGTPVPGGADPATEAAAAALAPEGQPAISPAVENAAGAEAVAADPAEETPAAAEGAANAPE